MHSESLLETFCLTDIMCFYAVARILKNLFVNEVKFVFTKIYAYVGP